MLPEVLLYDHLHVRGGAERFTLELRDALPGLRVVAAAADPGLFHGSLIERVELLDASPIASSAARRTFTALRRFAAYRPAGRPAVVLLSGHFAPLAIGRFDPALTAIYLHAWPLHLLPASEVVGASTVRRAAFGLFAAWYARRWRRAMRAASVVIANSSPLAERVAMDSGVDVQVLPPPVNLDRFHPAPGGDAYLSFARHEPQKRVHLAIEAFRRMPHRSLKVASSGSQTAELRRLAVDAGNIEFVGDLEPASLAGLIGRCRATIHVSRQEPFSLAVVESLACGKPVIACSDAGAVLALDGDDAMVLPVPPEPRVEDIMAAVERCERLDSRALAVRCRDRAEAFGTANFVARLGVLLASTAARQPPAS